MIWGSAYKYRLLKLEILQKKSVRNIFKAQYNAPSSPIFKCLNIPRVSDIIKIQTCKFMYNYTNSQLPSPLQSIFETNSSVHSHNTRHCRDPHIVHARTKLLSRSFVHNAPRLWIDLPVAIRSARSVHSFKSRLKKHYVSLYQMF